MRSRHVSVLVDLDRVRSNAESIRKRTGVALIAVIKADAYGLGASRVADAIASVVDDFAYFTLEEAREIGRPGLLVGPPEGELSAYRELSLRPSITNLRDAERFRDIPAAVSLDTGMQRFGCSLDELETIFARCRISEAMTHSADAQAPALLRERCAGRAAMLHAATTSLIDANIGRPSASAVFLDAVRPGYALYRGAMRVTTCLTTARDTYGPAGYTRFECPRIGVILAGYSNGLRAGPVVINGRRQRILEVGMNTAFVSLHANDREGDDVLLLGDELPETELATHYQSRPHEILCRYGAMGQRTYASIAQPVKLHT